MSKKTKKAQIAENQEANSTAEENQMEVTQVDAEVVPATIVEAGEAELFAKQTEGHDVVNATVEETVSAADGETTTQPAEQPAPKPPKPSKRPYIPLIEEHLDAGDMAKPELLALIMETFPEVNKNGASTFLTDALNPKYSHWKDRVVTKKADGKMIFADKIEAPAEEAPHAEAQPEAPAE